MQDEIVLIRPPSEARSFLLPVTIGCSHNACTFCGTFYPYKFRARKLEDILRTIDNMARGYSASVTRVFLENADALAGPQPVLVEVLKYLYKKFPNLERVGAYATPRSALIKSPEDLARLHRLGLKIAYLGVETGLDDLLINVNKGVTRARIVEAGRKLKQAGIAVSATVILGLAGPQDSERHAIATGKILSEIDPAYAGALTLMLVPGTPLHRDWQEGRFTPVTPFQALQELKLILENSDFTDCFFTANHASNYLPVKARLPQQKEALLALIEKVISNKDESLLRPEYIRAL